ncbi:MAG: TldD/PmbA family protein [candidate division WOR-3 bacterium]|nr:TldD/PmbA family protein [candidate division WOR-3 bacterium]
MIELGEIAVKQALELGADEAEAYLVQGKEFDVSYESNDIKLAKSQTKDGIGIRVFKNKCLGFASVNVLSEQKVLEAVNNAVRLATLTPEDKYNQLPTPTPITPVQGLFDPAAEKIEMDFALNNAVKMLQTVHNFDKRISVDSGLFSGSVYESGVVNSKGIKASEKQSSFVYYIFGMATEGNEVSCFQYEFDITHQAKEVNVEKVALDFAQKVINSLGAEKWESFKGTVLLDPDVVTDLFGVILFAINANNVQKGMSKFAKSLNQKVAIGDLSIEDNGLLKGGAASSSFDREGVARNPSKIIDKGILNSFFYNSYTANKDNRVSTGHATGGTRDVPAIGPSNFIISPGNKVKDELIKDIKKGLLVTRLSCFPNVVSGDFSGVVKGGFRIEDGKLGKPVIETMIAGNVFELLNQISGISKERKTIFGFIAPWLRIDDISITSG